MNNLYQAVLALLVSVALVGGMASAAPAAERPPIDLTVYLEGGQPGVGLKVVLWKMSDPTKTEVAASTTDSQGRVSFQGLAPTYYYARVVDPVLDGLRLVSTYEGNSVSETISARPFASLSGTYGTGGAAPRSSWVEREGLVTRLNSDGSSTDVSRETHFVYDPTSGEWTLQLLPAGKYRIRFAQPGYETGTFDVTVAASERRTGVNVTMRRHIDFLPWPRLSGQPVMDSTLTVDNAAALQAGGVSTSIEWLRNGHVVGTGASYRVQAADVYQRLGVRTTSVGAGYTPLTMDSYPATAPKPGTMHAVGTAAVVGPLSRGRARVGRTYRVNLPSVDVPQAARSVFWTCAGRNAPRGVGTLTYRLPKACKGKSLRVVYGFTADGYTPINGATPAFRVR